MMIVDGMFLIALGALAVIAWILESAGRERDEAEPGRSTPPSPTLR